MTSGESKFELQMGKGNMFKNDPKKETDKHDFYGAIKFQILDKRDVDL
mgnify:CR=1 FL=1